MTELETIQHAKNYLDKLARGINPLTNEEIPENDLLNNVRISRCLFYTANVLGKVLDNGGIFPPSQENLPPFSMDYRLLANFPYSESPLGISQIVDRVNELVSPNTMKKLNYTPISKWLIEHGYLAEMLDTTTGKRSKRPTALGQSIGIFTEERSGQYRVYTVTVYNTQAQRFVIEHLSEMLNR